MLSLALLPFVIRQMVGHLLPLDDSGKQPSNRRLCTKQPLTLERDSRSDFDVVATGSDEPEH